MTFSRRRSQLILLFNSFPDNIQKYLSNKFTEIPISNIENTIEDISTQRRDNPRDAEEFGEELYKTTKNDIILLKNLLGNNNIQIQMIVNKLADEILQCSIDFYNKHRDEDSDFDPGDDAFKIAQYAQSIGTTGQTKNRIEESLKFIQQWVADKTERQKQEAIDRDLTYISDYIKRFQKSSPSTVASKAIIVSCKPKLTNIKSVLGADNDFYLEVSSAVVQNALGMIIAVVNEAQKDITTSFSIIISNALSALTITGNLDMEEEVRTQYNTNKRIILSIKKQLDAASKTIPAPALNTSNNNTGCIAVLVIGAIIAIFIAVSNENTSNNYSSPSNYSSPQNHQTVNTPPVESKYKGNKLKNGTSPYNQFFGRGIYNKQHKNWVSFKNGYSTDAIVCLVDYYSGRVTRNEYIQAGTNFQMTNIPNSTYYIKVFSGKDWNPNKPLNGGKIIGGFDTEVSFYQSKNDSNYFNLNDDGTQYSTWNVTLYKVSNGNMQTQKISEDSFFD